MSGTLTFSYLNFTLILMAAVIVGVHIGIGLMSLLYFSRSDMADEADMTQARDEAEAPHRIAASRKPVGPLPNGRCHYCDEIVSDEKRWCDVTCRSQWSRQTGVY